MKQSKIENIMWEIYRELYQKSTPPADFDQLVNTAELDELGRKVIHYMDYEITESEFEEIIQKHLKGKRLSQYYKEGIRRNVLLGCSPKFKS
jgi:hypothetical protein